MTTTTPNPRAAQLAQAKLFAEVARRVQRPFDSLPPGDAARVWLLLWQEAAACAVAAAELVETPASGEATPAREMLERAAGGSEPLQALRALIPRESAAQAEPHASSRAELLAGFTQRLIDELERPVRTMQQQRLVRLARLGSAGLFALALLGFLLAWALRPPNLVPLAKRTLSSEYAKCLSGECGLATFHTKEQHDPWVSYDFGEPRTLHSIHVENRQECCYDRAVPLVVEGSKDQQAWQELARAEKPFLNWSSRLSGSSRYVRLRVEGKTFLHLKDVTIR